MRTSLGCNRRAGSRVGTCCGVLVRLSMSADYTRGCATRREQKAEEGKAAGCNHSGEGRDGEAAMGDPECEGFSGEYAWGEDSVPGLREGGSRFARMPTSQNRDMDACHHSYNEVV